jgi:adenine-specific DNA-methyltransferase
MPTLNWIGKDKVVSHHQDVPYRVLEHKYGFTADKGEQYEPTNSGNKIIHGDNLEALKSLLPEYEGKIKCIYIDPPYNTGKENWVYNDSVNHPKILKWLGEVVGKEGDDLSRHDKWLCMMYPRLQLLHKLLAKDGIIFISIDDYEYHNLLSITNEIFGIKNRIVTSIWDLGTGTQAGHFVRAHEYVLVYAKNKELVPNFKGGEGIIKHSALKKISYKNPASEFTFPVGTRFDAEDGEELSESWGGSEKTTLISGKMTANDGQLTSQVTLSAGWAMKSQMQSWFYEDPENTYDTKGQKVKEFYFNKSGVLTYIKEKSVTNPPTVLRGIANTKTGSSELTSIIGPNKFDFPKPSELIKFLLKLVVSEGDTVLDSFAGTGTTAHSIFKLNSDNNLNLNFILCISALV